MKHNSNYARGWNRVIKCAQQGSAPVNIGPEVGSMLAGGTIGGRLGENLAKRTRTEVLGLSIPGTEKIDPDMARLAGNVIGALGGGYAAHLGKPTQPAFGQ